MSEIDKVELRFIPMDGTYSEELTITLNGKEIASGRYGGEPEDNVRYRDYKWVEYALTVLSESLGADVSVIEDDPCDD